MRRLSIERDRHLKINEARTQIQRSREINSTKDELPQENAAKSILVTCITGILAF